MVEKSSSLHPGLETNPPGHCRAGRACTSTACVLPVTGDTTVTKEATTLLSTRTPLRNFRDRPPRDRFLPGIHRRSAVLGAARELLPPPTIRPGPEQDENRSR